MRILITGGGGFIGSRLASALLERGTLDGRRIEQLVLADQVAPRPELTGDGRVEARVGTLAGQCEALGRAGFDGVFHLASAVSGECEADFDLGLRSNLDTTRALLDSLRAATDRGTPAPRFVFSSSVAVFGPDPSVPLPELVGDDTLPAPKTSYGTHKLMCEHLIADYSRKGFVDGRSARLMTVTVRPGRPNGAASSFFSGIVREPLAGVEAICPVSPDVSHPLTSATRTIEGLIAIYEASVEQLGGRLALTCRPSTPRSPDARRARGGRRREVRARVRFVRDETICGHRRQLAARLDRGTRGAARACSQTRFRRHHPPVHRRLPRAARARRRAAPGFSTGTQRMNRSICTAASPSSPAGPGHRLRHRRADAGLRCRGRRSGTSTPPSSPRRGPRSGKGEVLTDVVELTREADVAAATERADRRGRRRSTSSSTTPASPAATHRPGSSRPTSGGASSRSISSRPTSSAARRAAHDRASTAASSTSHRWLARKATRMHRTTAPPSRAHRADQIAGKELATKACSSTPSAPAAAKTAMFATMTQQHIDFMLSKIPMGRFSRCAKWRRWSPGSRPRSARFTTDRCSTCPAVGSLPRTRRGAC
jgi:nucleoside-diphosphate-sugar epimerase